MATTYNRSAACIFTMLAALEDAVTQSGAPLDDVVAQIDTLRIKLLTNPQTLTEGEVWQAHQMLDGFCNHSHYNIRRFFRDLDPESSAPIDVILADGSQLADGSVTAA